MSGWTSIRPGAAAVPAGGRVTATLTITVPRDAAPGEEYGVIWAEARSAPRTDGGIVQVSRVGIRMYLSIGPGGPPAADFTIDALTAKRSAEGRPLVTATVHNTGGRRLDMSGSLRLTSGPGGLGLSAGRFPATLGVTLAIGDTEPVSIALNKQVPAGPWDPRITLKSGLLERSAQATVTFRDAGAALAVATAGGRPGWLYPAIAGAVVALLSLTGTGVRRRRRPWVTDPGRPTLAGTWRGPRIRPTTVDSAVALPRPCGDPASSSSRFGNTPIVAPPGCGSILRAPTRQLQEAVNDDQR